ncbi:hypothetical protein I6N95_02075 [Vagococcus sp. BWB3-3]|uniref:Uncharacterized protein n=1 Tax=Vagococcus allomyrinae TaxID=2794353 RepID=A0A940PBQ7_9ENTE|nr:hypothetical protein [Vagococcus allomyrinae]MBP1039788.1 hypothetical protein [Vagococcus allomyrinae]
MEILIELSPIVEGYAAKINTLPDFNLQGINQDVLLTSLPDALRHFISEWEGETNPKSLKYQQEFPVVQRIKSRGFYQSTIYRIKEVLAQKQLTHIDLELIHCLQRKDYEALMA